MKFPKSWQVRETREADAPDAPAVSHWFAQGSHRRRHDSSNRRVDFFISVISNLFFFVFTF